MTAAPPTGHPTIERHDVEVNASRLDAQYFTDSHLTIDEPQADGTVGGVLPFHLWPAQQDLLDTIVEERLVLILKARQLGISWVCCAYGLWRCIFNAGQTILCYSKGQAEANELIRRIKVMFERLPDWFQARLPALVKDNSSEIAWSNGSRVISLPATQNAGRSLTASVVFLDEAAFLLWADQLYTALKPTIDGGGKLVILSTANGVGNLFHKLWARAEEGRGNFVAVFLPWWARPGRTQAWYEAVKEDSTEPDKVKQEYPATAAEAFLVSGNPRFDAAWLDYQALTYVRPPKATRELPAQVAELAGLSLYFLPQHGRRYVIGGDVAEGVEGGDYSCGIVMEAGTWDEVAQIWGLWEPDTFGELLATLGAFFNRAEIFPERNNHGHTTLATLRRLRYPKIGLGRDGRQGWLTNGQTKPQMIDQLAEALRDKLTRVRTQATLAEMRIYRNLGLGKSAAPAGYNDDRVMAHAIAIQACMRPIVLPTRQSNYRTGSRKKPSYRRRT